jgi:hypothetical protein
LGFIGGAMARLLPDDKKFDIQSLGIYSVFSLPGKFQWNVVGCNGLETRVHFTDGAILSEPSSKNVIDFLLKCCNKITAETHQPNSMWYRLKGDIYFYQSESKQAFTAYLNYLLVDTDNFSNLSRMNTILSDGLLNRMIQLSIELNDGITALFFLQFQGKIDYEKAFGIIQTLKVDTLQGNVEYYIDPPNVLHQVSPCFCICDIYLLEGIISLIFINM